MRAAGFQGRSPGRGPQAAKSLWFKNSARGVIAAMPQEGDALSQSVPLCLLNPYGLFGLAKHFVKSDNQPSFFPHSSPKGKRKNASPFRFGCFMPGV